MTQCKVAYYIKSNLKQNKKKIPKNKQTNEREMIQVKKLTNLRSYVHDNQAGKMGL